MFDKAETEASIKLAFNAASVLTIHGGISAAINGTSMLMKVFGVLEITSGISSLVLDNSTIENSIVDKYGVSGQAFVDNVRFCLNMYNLASGTGQLIKLTTSYTAAKNFWKTNKQIIKNENLIAQSEYDKFDDFLDETKVSLNTKNLFSKSTIGSLNGFPDNIQDLVNQQGLNISEFKNLASKSALELTTTNASGLNKLIKIRNAIPQPDINTIMQKAIPKSDISKYLSGQYASCKGYMSTAKDSKHLKTYQDIYYGMRLDYPNTAFNLSDGSCGVIRFKAMNANLAKPAVNLPSPDPFPFTNHGITSASNNLLGVPEWKMNDFAQLQDGAEIWEVFSDGSEQLRAVYNKSLGKFEAVQ
jgi:hypothetical protein